MVTFAQASDLNLWAVLVAAVVVFAFGAIWYSPLLFGKEWQKMSLATYKSLSSKNMRERAGLAFVGSFLAYMVMAYVLEFLNSLLGVETALESVAVAGWVAFGFVLTHGLIHGLYHNIRRKLWIMNATYDAATLLIMGLVLGSWR